MVMDPRSVWNAELILRDGSKVAYDSPRCALLAWRSGQVEAREIYLHEYYDGAWRRGDELAFVVSSDVTGPMGADVVPVDPARAGVFVRDHLGTRPLRLPDLTAELLKELK
jgi:hypothetical protein